jgi:hypothetical protein
MAAFPRRLVSALALATLAACAPAEEEEPMENETASAQARAEAPVPLPDTTAAAVWEHLQDRDYRGSWALWPGKGELYSGGEPHGMLLTTYVNETARGVLESTDSVMPPGAILVKENFMPDSTLAAVTVMYKSQGYDPEHHDWWFMKRLADGTVEASGRVEGCQDCHGGAADNDYILTSNLGEALMGAAGG